MIRRDPHAAAEGGGYDLLIVGGGIYGVCLAMEASRRGLRPLLIERDDFGGATSWSSLRIVHGGLRYLQSLDLARFRQSVAERRWFCATYPELVEPLECLMPLYGNGLKRPGVLRAALLANDLLSWSRNAGVRPDRVLPGGRVLDGAATASLFPMVERDGLEGGAVWYDAVMTSSVRVLMETLRWACHLGATALNYVECVGLEREGRRVTGVWAVERLTGDRLRFRAPVVVNCAGPWSRALAGRLDREHASLFSPSLAVNVLLDREPPSPAALAVTPRRPGARTYFLRPHGKQVLAGTFHAACGDYPAEALPADEHVGRFLADLNAAVPALELTTDDLVRVYAGLLPARSRASERLSVRPVILDHGRAGGPAGLWSVSGVKYTTARLVAEHTVRRVFGAGGRSPSARPDCARPAPLTGLSWGDPEGSVTGDGPAREALARLVEEEAVLCMEDLLLRRTDWAADPRRLGPVATAVSRLLGRELPSRVAPLAAVVGPRA